MIKIGALKWPNYAAHRVAYLCRHFGGLFMVIIDWPHYAAYGMD
jgi:hypothetical protein